MDIPERKLTLRDETLEDQLLPLLRDRVFHVTSMSRFQAIRESGCIKSNRDRSLRDTFAQSKISLGRSKGWVCLFDLRNQTPEAIQRGLECLYFLAPRQLGDHIAFLLLHSTAYNQLVTWADIAMNTDLTAFRIPRVECWFPDDLPITLLEEALLIQIVRRPLDPNGPTAAILRIHGRHNS
jgi:hypothetical protein